MNTRVFSLAIVFIAFTTALPAAFAGECRKAATLSAEAGEYAASLPGVAEKKLREAVAMCSESAALHYNLAMVLYRQGRMNDASAELEEALRLKPDYARAMNALAYINYKRKDGDLVRAEALARRAVETEPSNGQFRDTLDRITAALDVDIPPSTGVSRPDAVAVIIGNRKYKSRDIPEVKYAEHDAEVVKKYLVSTLGYREANIMYYTDAEYADFLKLFGDEKDHRGILYNRTRKGRSDIFIYYSGHGAPDVNTGRPYILPVNADPFSVKFTGYSLHTLYNNLAKLEKEKSPRSITVVMDACFSGGSNEGMVVQSASPIYIEVVNPVVTMGNAAVFSSSKGNQISSWYPEKRHGLFTYFFLKALKDGVKKEGKITVRDLELALLGDESVNDYAWRLYNREQTPQVLGRRDIVLVRAKKQ